MATTLYDTLGVAKGASADEIKKAYRKLAREHHPDQGGDESRFKEIQGAYDVLSDPEKRKAYDTWGSTNGRGGPGAGPQFQDFDLSDLGDLFGGLFGGRGRRGPQPSRQPERGADVEAQVSLSFEDSLAGAEVRVPVELETACHTCAGSGAEPGTAPTVCPQCGGRGVTADSHGLFALSQPCPRCRGNGTIVEHPCATCRGTGRERTTKRYTVKIPAGAKDGTRIRLKGRGEAGRNGGPAGDLWVVTRVAPSDTYERRGSGPDRRRARDLPAGRARRLRRGADAGRPDLAEGAGGLAARQAAEGQGSRRAEAQGRRQGRPARAPQADGAGEGLEARARAARGAAEGGRLMDERPRYMISVAAELVGMHQQTLRMYESKGLVRPKRTPGGTRLYSEGDIERLRVIQRLTTELGLNLAGVEHVLRLEDELRRMQNRMDRLERELRDEIRTVHRSYRREIVVYERPDHPAPRH